jgi:RimJ/RimL family protein N-acetyltransferase
VRTTIIRPATETDVPRIVEMAGLFVASTPYRQLITVDRGCVEALVRRFLTHPTPGEVVLLVAEAEAVVVGMIAMLIFDHPISGERVASEIVWWMDPTHRGTAGLRLLRAAEQWAQAQQAAIVQMIAPTAKVERFYEAVGYTAVERNYQRRIACCA